MWQSQYISLIPLNSSSVNKTVFLLKKNKMEYYNDFLTYLSECMTKIQELLEKVTINHNEAAICLLETSALYKPQILIDLTEMSNNGTRFDEYILEGEMVRDQLEKLIAQPQQTTDYYKSIIEELGIVEATLSSM